MPTKEKTIKTTVNISLPTQRKIDEIQAIYKVKVTRDEIIEIAVNVLRDKVDNTE